MSLAPTLEQELAERPGRLRLEAARLVRDLDSLGDRVGQNDPDLANALWRASTIVREALAASRERAKVAP
jgi:hypothetical protein